ncbi:speriolin-like protein isoform X1 [Antechinus flavipes]|uniref:speriolin-like protein isoform X1 n=1 Tax=Antechinus flavipes TaxID=38775 RepID=UPI002235DD9D|nr:speriolin-like protein isoform X1 [Antechinus flavipes]
MEGARGPGGHALTGRRKTMRVQCHNSQGRSREEKKDMAEGNELMNRLMSENADLKKQVRLMKENQMLKRLLNESCHENSNRNRDARDNRDFIFPKVPGYPEACSPGAGGPALSPEPLVSLLCTSVQSSVKQSSASQVAEYGRLINVPEASTQLQPSALEDLLYSHINISNEEDTSSPTCNTPSQVAFKGFLSPPDIYSSRTTERKLSQLLSNMQDSMIDKPMAESKEIRQKKVCFSESGLPGGDKMRKSYYLNDSGGCCALRGAVLSSKPEIQSFTSAEKDGRIVGEIAFQLDRRILAYVFPGVTRLYGFTVSNIPEKIKQTSIKSLDGSVDEKKLRDLTHRYLTLTTRLEKLGYNREVHPVFSEFLINTYGILKQRPDLRSNPLHNNPAALRKLVIDIVPPKFLGDSLLLLNCLCELSKEDSKPLFAW